MLAIGVVNVGGIGPAVDRRPHDGVHPFGHVIEAMVAEEAVAGIVFGLAGVVDRKAEWRLVWVDDEAAGSRVGDVDPAA